MKNKLFSLGIVFLFMFSLVSVAIAQEDNTTQTDTGTQQLGLKERFEAARTNIQAARTNILEARQNYIDARQKFLEQRSIFIASKAKLAGCRGDFSEKCNLTRAGIRSNAKAFLLNNADLVLKLLDNLKVRISNSNMNDDEKNSLLSDIDARIKEVEDAKAKIAGLTKDSTNEEIKNAAEAIRSVWIDTRKDIKRSIGHLVNFRVGEIIVKAERLEERLNKVVERAKANGKDTTNLESLITKFKEKISEARDKYNSAKAKYIEAKTAGDVDAVIKEANQYLRDAQRALKEAHGILKDIVADIRKQGQEKALEESSTGANQENTSEASMTEAT